jgi:hypothetical protein
MAHFVANRCHTPGSRYLIIRGSGLRDGQTMTSGDVQAAVQSYRIWSAEPGIRIS